MDDSEHYQYGLHIEEQSPREYTWESGMVECGFHIFLGEHSEILHAVLVFVLTQVDCLIRVRQLARGAGELTAEMNSVEVESISVE